MALMGEVLATLLATATSVLPIVVFLLAFHRLVLRQELANAAPVLFGLVLVVVGLALLLIGLDKALFPVGRLMVDQLTAGNVVHGAASPAPWTHYAPVYAFAFLIAFGAAMAEPALLTISLRVNEISGGAIGSGALRVAAALGVASGVVLGCIRIVAGIPLHWCVGVILLLIVVQTLLAPRSIVPLAYDAGGVSTTAVTVPVVTALGLGLAEQLPGRSPLLDGFGLIILACLLPAVTVLAYAQVSWVIEGIQSRRNDAAKRRRARGKEE